MSQQALLYPKRAAVFSPLSLSGLKLWLKADAGLTLSTTPYAGTGTITKSGQDVTGSGTSFIGEVKVGDTLTATGITGTVTAIASATALTMDTSETQAVGQAFTINPTAGASDRVTTWADQSGNAINAGNAAASQKPAKIPAVKNGLPIVRFDRVNDTLTFAPVGLTGLSIYMVSRHPFATENDGNTHSGFFNRKNAGSVVYFTFNDRRQVGHGAGQALSLFNDSGGLEFPNLSGDVGAFHISTLSATPSAFATRYYNTTAGTPVAITTFAGGADSGVINSPGGIDQPYDDYCEIAMFDGEHSAAVRAQMWAYLNARWALY